MSTTLDLNADLGEGFGAWSLTDDTALLEVVTSANVACGFHAGDPSTMRAVCEGAAERGVTIGAQVSYRDLAGFGRRFIDVDPVTLADEVSYQLAALRGFAVAAGADVGYVKPHGALYNACVRNETQAHAVVEGVCRIERMPVLGLPGSALLAAAETAGCTPVREAFADRGYAPDGTLVPRSEPGALLEGVDAVVARAVGLAVRGEITCADRTVLSSSAHSLCLHGDSDGAVAAAAAVRDALLAEGVRLAPFTR